MGVTAIRKLAVLEQTELTNYSGRTVAVDAHHWLFRYMTVQVRYLSEEYYTTDDGREVPNLIGMLRGLPTLLNAGITPIFVFDGTPHALKRDEIENRRASKLDAITKMEAAIEAGNIDDIRRFKSQSQSLTPIIQETTRDLLTLLGIPYAEADGAGEGFAARLAIEHDEIDAVFTGDYDAILFGSPETVRKWSGTGAAERIRLDATLEATGLSHRQLVDAAILIGTDYNQGVYGIGPKRAVDYLRNGRTVEDILEDRDASISGLEVIRRLFLEPPTGTLRNGTALSQPDFESVEEFLCDEWDVPRDVVIENLHRFPRF